MRELRCDSCMNARPVVSENGIHHICALHITKSLRCMAGDDYYEPIIRPENITASRAFEEALRKAIRKYEKKC